MVVTFRSGLSFEKVISFHLWHVVTYRFSVAAAQPPELVRAAGEEVGAMALYRSFPQLIIGPPAVLSYRAGNLYCGVGRPFSQARAMIGWVMMVFHVEAGRD